MKIQQLSVFIENKSGKLLEITEILKNANIDIRAMSVADTSDFGILRLIVDKPEEAAKAFKNEGKTVSLTSVIGLGIDDKPGSFSKAVELLTKNDIAIEYMYAFISREEHKAYVVLRVNEEEKAIKLFEENDFELISSASLD